MVVKPFWWCPECRFTHDSQVSRCLGCNSAGPLRKAHASGVGPTEVATKMAAPDSLTLVRLSPEAERMRQRTWAAPEMEEYEEALLRSVGRFVLGRGGAEDGRERGAGIGALALRKPERPRPPRRETRSWGPYDAWDLLPDADGARSW